MLCDPDESDVGTDGGLILMLALPRIPGVITQREGRDLIGSLELWEGAVNSHPSPLCAQLS